MIVKDHRPIIRCLSLTTK